MITRYEELLAYFDRLIAAANCGHVAHEEIDEVIAEIKKELSIGA